jgi:hypothetical protein
MTSQPLRGERYVKDASPTFVRFLTEKLPYLDYDGTLDFYKEWLPRLKDPDEALLGCNDRFYLLTGLLNRKDACHPWLFERCREVEARPDGYLDLWARAHYKSTIGTFAGSIQEALDDPETVTIGIFANTREISRPFLAQIKEELEGNDHLKQVYADVLWDNPRKEAPKWSIERGLVLKRKSNPKEATFEAHGLIDAMPTGRHFSHHYYDDIINEKNVGNPDQIKKATERFELADNLGPTTGTAKKRIYGTRYSFADSYGVLLERGVLKPRLHPATKDGSLEAYRKDPKTGAMVSNLVLLSPEVWEEKKKLQRSTLAAQMLQNPLAGQENLFLAEWLKGYYVRPAMMHVYIMADPSLGIHKTSDRTAMAVVGVDSNQNKYLLDGYCHRMGLSEKWLKLRDLWKKWSGMHGVQLVKVGYERYGQQADAQYFEERMKAEGVRFEIEELNWTRNRQGESKEHRVARLEPDFRNGSFFVPAKVWHPGSPLAYDPDPDKQRAKTEQIAAQIEAGTITKPASNLSVWSINDKGQIAYRAYLAPHESERRVRNDGELWRLMLEPLRRIDEDGAIYDLTRVFFEEFLFFPFSPRDDLIDATSRIYDMDPEAAEIFETVEPESYPDD